MRLAVLICFALGLPLPARACEAALLLAMDVSGSVDPAEWLLQREGLQAALRDGQLRDILVQDRVALSVMQWSGAGQQSISIDWQRLETPAAVEDFAARVAAMPRAFAGSDTAVGQALSHGLDHLAPVADCRRKIIDMSGDGDENAGFSLPAARRRAIAAGVEVNALAIESMGLSITAYYRARVITPGGFVETARGHLDYARAIRAKMLKELARPAM